MRLPPLQVTPTQQPQAPAAVRALVEGDALRLRLLPATAAATATAEGGGGGAGGGSSGSGGVVRMQVGADSWVRYGMLVRTAWDAHTGSRRVCLGM